MSEGEIIDVGESTLPAHPRPVVAPSLLGHEPDEVVERATKVANALAPIIRNRELYTNIGGREHVRVEGWTTLGAMLGVFPALVSVEWPEDGVCRAIVAARTLGGAEVGRASALCTRHESNWANRDGYALESMAQTRATSKALRMPLGFIMSLAGYEATPAEEMEGPQSVAPPMARPAVVNRGAATGRGPTPTGRKIADGLAKNGTWPFGKYKDTKPGELPENYLEWVVKEWDDRPILRAVAENELNRRRRGDDDVSF